MNIDELTVAEVGREADPIFANLFELYMHDMAQWFLFESNNQGRYGYDHVPHWAAGDRFYLAHVGAQPAGFALVGSAARWLDDASAHDVVEFFVLRRYRGTGVSEALARAIWDAYPGQWLVRVFEGNLPAVPFWRRAVSVYSAGACLEERRREHDRDWRFFTFTAPAAGA